MSDWQVTATTEVYKTPWIRVRRDEVLNHNKKPLTYSVVELNHSSVFIVATSSDERILLQKNYRYTLDKTLWEIPAGHSDGEDLLAAAKRELLEEAGLTSDDWTDLGLLYQAAGIGNIPLQVFLARNTSHAQEAQEKSEQITNQHFMSIEEIEQMATRGEIVSAPILAAIYLAKLHSLKKGTL